MGILSPNSVGPAFRCTQRRGRDKALSHSGKLLMSVFKLKKTSYVKNIGDFGFFLPL